MRGIIKFVLISIIFIVGMSLFTFMRLFNFGAIPMAIVAIGMFAAIRAIWKYNPKSKEITLQKED